MSTAPRTALLGSALASTLLLASCGGGTTEVGAGTATEAAEPENAQTENAQTEDAQTEDTQSIEPSEDLLSVVAAFYPLEFLAERVGGDRAEVVGLTPPGAEAHDLELSPQSVATLGEADLLVVLGDFQPAIDEALGGTSAPVLDLDEIADRPYGEEEGAHDDEPDDEHAHDDEHTDEAHTEDAHEEDAHDHGDTDPHFWTDPTHMAEAAEAVAGALSEADPDGAEVYTANAETLVAELTQLDEEAMSAFASCEIDTLVTAHDAFGYFADRYGFETRPIAGLAPGQEPDARTLAEISDFVAESSITTVYTETLVSSAIADTVAAEAGVQTAVLDPVEGLTDESAGEDYLEVMRSNIETVRTGQACG